MLKKPAEVSRLPFVFGILGLAFLNLLLFGDILFNGNGLILSSSRADLFLHFTAWRQFAFNELRQGHLVLWNPHYLCGAPFFGNFESGLLYPLNWIYLVLPLPLAINSGIVLHVFLAGFFTFVWARHRGLYPAACFVAGTIFMFGGAYFLHVFAGHLPNLCTMVWAPLIFLSIDDLIDKKSANGILLGIFAVSMQILAGHPQYVYFTAILATVYVLLNLRENENKFEISAGFAAIYVGAAFVTAVQLWTGLQALSECGRNIPLEYRSAGSFSFPPENLITMFLPDFFGNLTTSPYWGRWFLWEISLFIGVSGFFLTLLAVGSGDPLKRRWALTTAFIAFVFSLGVFTPAFRIFYDWVPGFKELRGVCKFDFLVSLFLAMLAGIGLDYLIKNKRSPPWSFLAMAFIGFVFFGVEIFIMCSLDDGLNGDWVKWFTSIHWLKNSLQSMDLLQREKYVLEASHHTALSLFIGGVTCLFITVLLAFQKLTTIFIYAVAALVVVELFCFAHFNRPTFEFSNLQKTFDQIRNFYDRNPGEYRVYGTASASLVTGGYDIWEDEPMVLGRYGRFICYSQGLSENQLFSVLPIFKRFHPVFGMMRLKYRVHSDQDPVQFDPFPFKILPRMLLLNQWEVVSDNQKILPALFDPKFDPSRKVYLEMAPDPIPVSGSVQGKLEWKDLSTEQVDIKVDIPNPFLLLVTDNYSSGWHARALPGSAQNNYKIMPGNYFLKVIPLCAGKHHFVLEYLPPVFVIGKWVSMLSCLIYIGILLNHLRKKPIFK